ncbi:MAG: hypothetical protein C0621_00900 [Desulfuromonas sp.]|nr:MAG: hypothetical protein C0621_00900 [Desulfuromonas sp.]
MTRFFFLVLLALLPATVWGEESPLTLQEALKLGISHNLAVKVEALSIPLATAAKVTEEAAFDPTLFATLSSTGSRTPLASTLTPAETLFSREEALSVGMEKRLQSGGNASLVLQQLQATAESTSLIDPEERSVLLLQLSQPLLRDRGAAATTLELQLAKSRQEQALLGYRDRARLLVSAIESACYDLAEAQAQVAAQQEGEHLAEELLGANRRRFEAGIIALGEVQQAETALAARTQQRVIVEQQRDLARQTLATLLGPPPGRAASMLTVADLAQLTPVAPADLAAAATRALRLRPDLEQQRLALEQQGLQLEQAQQALLPRLDLEATLGVNGLSGEGTGGYADGRGGSLGSMAVADGYQWSAGLTFSYPLGNRAARQKRVQRQQEQRQALLQLQQLETAIVSEVESSILRWQHGEARLAAAQRYAELARLSLAHEQARLDEGLSDTFRLIDFQQQMVDASVTQLTAAADLARAAAALRGATGDNLETFSIFLTSEREEL